MMAKPPFDRLDTTAKKKKNFSETSIIASMLAHLPQLKSLYEQTQPLLWLPRDTSQDIKNIPSWYEWLFCINFFFLTSIPRKGSRARF